MAEDQTPEDSDRETDILPESTALLLATFSDLYRQEVGAEEDVHRTLPFFGTALGLVIGALAYAAGRLPKFTDLIIPYSRTAFIVSALLLALAVVEAACTLFWVSRAIARQEYQRLGPETALRTRLKDLQDYYNEQSISVGDQDKQIVNDMRQALLDSYTAATPTNRELNQRRYRFRAIASSHLVRSLIWALAATTIILIADKFGLFPKVSP